MKFIKFIFPSIVVAILFNACTPSSNCPLSYSVYIAQVGSNKLKADAWAGREPYSYSWSTGVNGLSEITVSTFGTYSVTATDLEGCTVQSSFNYHSTTNPCDTIPISVTIRSTVDILLNYSLKAKVTGGHDPYTFIWSTGEHGDSIVAPQPGAYSVTVTDLSECTATASVTVACKTGCVGCDGVTTVTDIDGNVYDIVKLGAHCWMADNLRTSRYKDGSPILEANDSVLWVHHNNDFSAPSDTGTWCYYVKDPANDDVFGKLYNWAAINDPRGICPQGWRMPTDAEWAAMVDTVSDRYTAATLLKSADLWPSSDTSNNLSGFTAVPSRERLPDAKFNIYSFWANFWTTTEDAFDPFRANAWLLNTDVAVVYAGTEHKGKGFSCRCIKE